MGVGVGGVVRTGPSSLLYWWEDESILQSLVSDYVWFVFYFFISFCFLCRCCAIELELFLSRIEKDSYSGGHFD